MKQPWEWDRSDLDALVLNKEPESSVLEFKRSDALKATDAAKNEISKDISAFANSNGGTIVYGIEEDKNHRASGVDDGCDPSEISTEWLEQVAYSRIQPKLDGLTIHEIALGTGRYVYVVYIPKGVTAHQASDKRYYMRLNFTTVAMEDYQLRDVMNRSSAPDLKLRFSSLEKTSNRPYQPTLDVDLQISIENDGIGVAEYCIARIHIPTNVPVAFHAPLPIFSKTKGSIADRSGGSIISTEEWTAYLGPVQGLGIPIFKTINPLPVDNLRVTLPIPNQYVHDVDFPWIIEAPHMQPKQGRLRLTIDSFLVDSFQPVIGQSSRGAYPFRRSLGRLPTRDVNVRQRAGHFLECAQTLNPGPASP